MRTSPVKRIVLSFLLSIRVAVAAYPPEGASEVTKSSKGTFRIESYGVQKHANWIVPQDKRVSAPVLLPDPPNASKLYTYEFSVSPEEQWILLTQKQYHGANAAWLYERTAPFHYTEVSQSPFSEGAWAFFRQQTHHAFKTDYRYIIRVSDWPSPHSRTRKLALTGGSEMTSITAPNDQSLAVSLYGDDEHTQVDLWFCYYDLSEHRFYLDAALEKHNKASVNPSRKQ